MTIKNSEGNGADKLTRNRPSGITWPMADKGKKWGDNVAGKFFVDDQCIDCDACRSEAPNHFKRNEDNGYSYVHKQPETDEEIARCQAALEACPVEAIGSDGD